MEAVFTNGHVITMNRAQPEVTAFAVVNERFYAVGDTDQIHALLGPDTPVVDLNGKTVFPGFIESHSHISMYATTLLQADCSFAVNQCIADVKARVHEMKQTTPADQWVRGWGYDDTLIAEKRHLTRDDLDDACPQQPVMIRHVSGHLAYANSKALEIAGIGPQTPQPDGGEIHKDAHGVPSGLLLEPGAINLLVQHIPAYTTAQFKKVLPDAMAHYNSYGITSTHDAAVGYGGEGSLEECRAYSALEAGDRLNLRIYLTIVEEQYQKIADLGLGTGFGSEFLKLGSVKLFQDGSIQALTAALSQGYHNNSDVKGEFIHPQQTLEDLVLKYHSAGLQLAIHANGDSAIESVLLAIEKAQDLHHRDDHRHMIIHCQTASLDHIQRMKKVGAIPSYFANHVYYWGDRHQNLFLGPERAQRIDPLGTSLKAGLRFSLHSDLPVTPVDPIFSIHTAVNRITREGHVLGPEERIPVLEALKAYTINAAYCSFEEDVKGAIAPGMLADFTVLSENLLTVDPLKIKDIKVIATAVGGRLVYGSL